MHQPLISCIVPAFNSARYIREALNSVLGQTYQRIEVIVVDDGSTDDTAAIVDEYRSSVRYVWQNNCGPAATRNRGVDEATGTFVAFLDADDLWHPTKLARQLEAFAAQPALDLCITHVQMFWSDELSTEALYYQAQPRAQAIPGYATTTLLARRAAWAAWGHFNTALWFADATDWFIQAVEQGAKLELLPEVLVYHRMHSANLTRRRNEASSDEFLKVVKARLDRQRGKHGPS